ncbi:solute:sodium symporter family transporter [Paremcibacter congregatus]|uniref:Solute:sodium symporter family transporter n=1 Tax=Paremcibacter congregatus TaxID=2043170 RepID=A0A2G4YW16_9PROT|nr:solute:sodium symporter family transporter [Paremcibacter congregatus]PHZ86531.1 solute:sodium symporter family transporter [Paremcibacter congregatus]QDE26334.1 solute:sodium symporter family transporter [Paremcibacter congregatus]
MLTFVSFVGFTVLVAVISYMKTRHDKMDSSDAYFLGGRSLTAWTIAGSLMLTNLSTEHLIGLNADAFNHTIAVAAWETTAALAMVLTALYFLPKYLNSGLTTIPQFLTNRYDEKTRVIATLLFLLSYAIAILPVVLLFGATGIESLFDVSETLGLTKGEALWLTVWGVGCLGSLYAIFGGLKAVAISDTINGVGFLIAGLMIPILALIMIGDGDFFAGLNELYTEEHEKFDITGNETGSFLPFGVLFTGMIVNQIFFWCTNQSIVQRALGAKNLAEGQKGVLLAAGFKLLGPFVIVLPGVIAFHMFKDVLPAEDYLLAYPMLVKAVLPTVLTGFFAAVMIGAVLSTFNSVLNSSATLFCEGIYKVFYNRDASGPELVKAGRITSIILALAAMTAAPLIDTSGSLYNFLQKVNATFFGPMLAVILLGMMTKHVSAFAAKIGLIAGPIVFYMLVFGFGDQVQTGLMAVFGMTDEVHFLHLLAFVFVLTVLGMLLISHFKPAEHIYVAVLVDAVDVTPWRHAKLTGVIISLITVGFYVLLAQ